MRAIEVLNVEYMNVILQVNINYSIVYRIHTMRIYVYDDLSDRWDNELICTNNQFVVMQLEIYKT